MVVCGYGWLHVATSGYRVTGGMWLVMGGYEWLRVVMGGYGLLQVVTGYCGWLQVVASGCRGLRGLWGWFPVMTSNELLKLKKWVMGKEGGNVIKIFKSIELNDLLI